MKEKDNREYIKIEELEYFMLCSWVSGFTVLGANLQKEKVELEQTGISIPSVSQLATWAKTHKDNINVYVNNSIKEAGINLINREITYENYKRWIEKDARNIQLYYHNKFITIATNLISLDDIEYIDM